MRKWRLGLPTRFSTPFGCVRWNSIAALAADEFFTGERKKYDEAFEISSDRLSAFAIANNAYSIDEQRKLTLERRNELQAAAVRTRSSIVEKQNQASATAAQIANLKPIAQVSSSSRSGAKHSQENT